MGKGSTFCIYLPASDKIPEPEPIPRHDIKRGTETVLIADDELMVLEVSKRILEQLGYSVLTASNGKEAVSVYSKNAESISLVVLDMIMPEMTGGETFDRLKAINPDIKVLLSSGYSINGDAASILQRGCRGFIQKPFRVDDLSLHVRDILDNP